MIYLTLYGGLLFGAALSSRQRQLRRLFFFVFTLLLFAFVAFRYEVGCDWSGYASHFEETWNWDASDALQRTEPAYWLLLVQLHKAGLDYPYLNLAMAIPFFWGLVALARRQPDPLAFLVLSFPVLIINMPMSAVRQAAAIGFACLAIIAFQDRKLIRYITMIVAGSLFHASAIVFLALAPFAKLRLTRASILLAVVLALPGAYFLAAGSSAEVYTDRYIGATLDAKGAIYRSAMLAAVGAYFLLARRRRFQERFPREYQIAVISSCIMLGTLALLPLSSVISDRFGYYVTPIQIMIMARLPYLGQTRQQTQLIAAAPYLALGLVLLVLSDNSELFQQCYLPYQTWLSWRY
jgi:EpsG family